MFGKDKRYQGERIKAKGESLYMIKSLVKLYNLLIQEYFLIQSFLLQVVQSLNFLGKVLLRS